MHASLRRFCCVGLSLLSLFVIVVLAVAVSSAQAAEAAPKSLEEAGRMLASEQLSDEQAQAVLKYFQQRHKGKDLTRGDYGVIRQELPDGGGLVGWFLQAKPGAKVTVMGDRQRSWPLRELAGSGYFVRVERFPNFSGAGYYFDVDGKKVGGGKPNRFGFEKYELTADSLPHEGVPQGELIAMPRYTSDKHFSGTQRDWWVYVPAQYRDDGPPAHLLVCQDGGGFCTGEGNACTVLDNLIYQGRLPVTIGVFINPGVIPSKKQGQEPYSNRSNEYDTCTSRYVSFLADEILPQVAAKYRLSDDPKDRAICGSSSGASCAFTAAWQRPDLFGNVISFVGSFADFRPVDAYPSPQNNTLDPNEYGPWKTAHDYPGLIRRTEPAKPIRVFLQDGENDLDNQLGNWPLNNQRMAAALAYSGYDYKFVMGPGVHSKKHGMSILPEILLWTWGTKENGP